jgi:hypothetical protein
LIFAVQRWDDVSDVVDMDAPCHELWSVSLLLLVSPAALERYGKQDDPGNCFAQQPKVLFRVP